MRRHRLDVVDAAARAPTRLVRESRSFRDGAVPTQGRILNIPVKAIDQIDDTRKVHVRMLNYLTAPHVVVWSASRASCSVPGVYAPFPLLARDPDGSLRYEGQDSHDDHFEPTLYVDGSMGADLPIELSLIHI